MKINTIFIQLTVLKQLFLLSMKLAVLLACQPIRGFVYGCMVVVATGKHCAKNHEQWVHCDENAPIKTGDLK